MNEFPKTLIAALFVVAFATMQAQAQPQPVDREYQMKAIYLYHFSHLVKPTQRPVSNSPFVIGIIGRDPFQIGQTNYLGRLRRRLEARMGGRQVSIRVVNYDSLMSCNVIYVPRGQNLNKPRLRAARDRKILVITEASPFDHDFMMINFAIVANRIKIQLSREAIESARFQIGRELLNISNLELQRTKSRDE